MYQKLYKPWTKGNLVIFEHEEVAVSLKTACLACFGDLNLPCLVWQMLMFPLPVRIYLKKNLGDDWLKQRWGSIPQLSENNLKNNIFLFPTTLTAQRREKKPGRIPGESLGWKMVKETAVPWVIWLNFRAFKGMRFFFEVVYQGPICKPYLSGHALRLEVSKLKSKKPVDTSPSMQKVD